jgi:hypothetical protein
MLHDDVLSGDDEALGQDAVVSGVGATALVDDVILAGDDTMSSWDLGGEGGEALGGNAAVP